MSMIRTSVTTVQYLGVAELAENNGCRGKAQAEGHIAAPKKTGTSVILPNLMRDMRPTQVPIG